MHIEEVGFQVVDCATTVHRALGPGLLESSYKECLAYELRKRGLKVETEVDLAVIYDGVRMKTRYRIDMIVEGLVIVEPKAVSHVLDVHDAQLLTHLRHRNLKLGFRINFHEVRLNLPNVITAKARRREGKQSQFFASSRLCGGC